MQPIEDWTDDELAFRKEEITHLLTLIPSTTKEPLELKRGVMLVHTGDWGYDPDWWDFYMEWHAIDEEQETRAYYQLNPSPTRAEFWTQQTALLSN